MLKIIITIHLIPIVIRHSTVVENNDWWFYCSITHHPVPKQTERCEVRAYMQRNIAATSSRTSRKTNDPPDGQGTWNTHSLYVAYKKTAFSCTHNTAKYIECSATHVILWTYVHTNRIVQRTVRLRTPGCEWRVNGPGGLDWNRFFLVLFLSLSPPATLIFLSSCDADGTKTLRGTVGRRSYNVFSLFLPCAFFPLAGNKVGPPGRADRGTDRAPRRSNIL